MAGAQSALFPFWSPDGKYLAFFSQGKLKKVPVAGGTVQVLCDAPEGRGGSWNEQGTIIFAPRIAGSLQSVSDGGGTPVEITKGDKSDQGYTDRDAYFLPDGKHFLFVRRAKDSGSVYAGSLDGGDIKQILPAGSNVAYSDGSLFYVKEGALTAQEFDPPSLSFKGKPVSIASNVEFAPARNEGSFSVSRNVLLYRHSSVVNRELAWLDLSGKEVDHWGEPAPYLGGNFFSATQTALLLRSTPGGNGYSLWISDVARKTVNRLTQDSDRAATGAVSPDGKDVLDFHHHRLRQQSHSQVAERLGHGRKSVGELQRQSRPLRNLARWPLPGVQSPGPENRFRHLHDGSAGREKARPGTERSLGRMQRPCLPGWQVAGLHLERDRCR